jgi:homoserine O-acetyltransferase
MTLTQRCSDHNREPALAGASPRLASSNRGELKLALKLRHGGEVATPLRYELVGNEAGRLLIVAGGISAGRHALSSTQYPEPGWWEMQRAAFVPERYRLLSVDWIGADGRIDLPIDPCDQADGISSLLAQLGLGKAAAFIGASYGGMVGMHLAARHPDRLGALLAISAAARPHPYSSACRSLQRQALSLGESLGDPQAGIALARAMAMLTYRTPQEFADRFAAQPKIERGRVSVGADDYLAAQGARHGRRMSATAYRRLSESIDLHHLDAAKLRVPLTLAAVDQDALVPAPDITALADAVPGARLEIIRSRYGHDAFLKEDGQVAAIITQFLSSLEHGQ